VSRGTPQPNFQAFFSAPNGTHAFQSWEASEVCAGFPLTIINHLYKVLLMSETLNLDAAFSALADPTRRAILARLAKGEATVMELAKPFEMTQPAISQHLKVLENAGIVARRVDGTRRPRRLAKAGIEAMDQWLAMLRKALEKNYDRLDEVLAGMEQPKIKKEEKNDEQVDSED
jgi:DNA-binding transcriptional ArsR family regulator